ncbi:hypothetical protein EUGRSUZ_A02072 [Eucalyptus grandis]|uniref:Uncharacterized protein n=2 Tax=Eucalyptus grandis TaxID=71139 RepID=A0ACC3M555_EUCGR|nr:hypothetical protein EUGRSUZ_A02072 [Eucalyptus grandis]
MEYPSGHHSHRHHRRDDDDDGGGSPRNRPFPPPGSALPPDFYGQPPPPRPPFYGGGRDDDFGPPPPPRSNVYHTSHSAPPPDYPPPGDDFASGYPPPPQRFSQGSAEYSDYPPPPPPPPPATVEHVAHEVDEPSETGHHSYRPHLPSFLHHHTQHQSEYDPADAADASGGGALGSYFANKPTYKVYCKAEPNYSLTIRDSKVILAPSDSSDPYQKWYKDEKFSTRVKDEDGFPCFSLVNKATGEAIKHSVGASHPLLCKSLFALSVHFRRLNLGFISTCVFLSQLQFGSTIRGSQDLFILHASSPENGQRCSWYPIIQSSLMHLFCGQRARS